MSWDIPPHFSRHTFPCLETYLPMSWDIPPHVLRHTSPCLEIYLPISWNIPSHVLRHMSPFLETYLPMSWDIPPHFLKHIPMSWDIPPHVLRQTSPGKQKCTCPSYKSYFGLPCDCWFLWIVKHCVQQSSSAVSSLFYTGYWPKTAKMRLECEIESMFFSIII